MNKTPRSPPQFSRLTDSRVQRVMKAKEFYYWSIKNKKLMYVCEGDLFDESEEGPLCIARYDGVTLPSKLFCPFKVTSIESLKIHILKRESRWMRELMWSKITEVPSNLKREREIGDLTMRRNDEVIRLELGKGITVVDYTKMLRLYFKFNGCPCHKARGISGKCGVTNLFASTGHVFGHMAYLERIHKKYLVFKASEDEITDNGFDRVTHKVRQTKTKSQNASSINSSSSPKIEYDSSNSTTYTTSSSNLTTQHSHSKFINSSTKQAHINRTQIEAPIDENKEYRTFIIGGRKVEILFDRQQTQTIKNQLDTKMNEFKKAVDLVDLTIE